MESYVIITGTSRGIGWGLAQTYIEKGCQVIGMARSESKISHPNYHHVSLDLADPKKLEETAKEIFSSIDPANARSIYLINNAGRLDPIELVGSKPDGESMTKSLAVNVHAPMLLSELFIKTFQSHTMQKRILNISSGAGRKPYPGWAVYCASKAALDMHSQVMAVEQTKHPHPVRIVSLAPGVVDTEMQSLIRQQSEENFPLLQRFLDLKASQKLWTPDFVAGLIITYVERDDFGEKIVDDIREYA